MITTFGCDSFAANADVIARITRHQSHRISTVAFETNLISPREGRDGPVVNRLDEVSVILCVTIISTASGMDGFYSQKFQRWTESFCRPDVRRTESGDWVRQWSAESLLRPYCTRFSAVSSGGARATAVKLSVNFQFGGTSSKSPTLIRHHAPHQSSRLGEDRKMGLSELVRPSLCVPLNLMAVERELRVL